MLFVHLTDVQGDGAKFSDDSMTTLLEWGTRPLARNGAAEVTLALDEPAGFCVWELAASGKRVGKVESSMSKEGLCFKASVCGQGGARMLYEIVCE
jgi:hypothetical protein